MDSCGPHVRCTFCTPPSRSTKHTNTPAPPSWGPRLLRCMAPQAGGLSSSCIQRLMRESNPPAVLVDTLLVVSQLARLNKDAFNTYEPIAKAAIYPNVRK